MLIEELSQQSPEEIREQIAETKASLADKVDAIETEVRVKVEEVKEEVHERIEAVKETFNLSHHVSRHPWWSIAAGITTGMAIGMVLGNRDRSDKTIPLSSSEQGILGRVVSEVESDIVQTKNIAVDAGVKFLGSMIKSSLPLLLSSVVNGFRGAKEEAPKRATSAEARGITTPIGIL